MLLGFKKRFVPKIYDGSKIFTLREKPKRMPKIGETLHMYTGLRTKQCEFITRDHKLASFQEAVVKIKLIYGIGKKAIGFTVEIKIGKTKLPKAVIDFHFTISDGFKDLNDFVDYWTEGMKKDVNKELIMFHWTDFKY